MKVSINKFIINKNEQKAHQSKHFEPFDLTPEQLSGNISNGFAFSYQFMESHRKADNFLCSDIIAADFDSGMTLDEALNNQFFLDNACILYTTPSHTEENNRFRIIFQLSRTITDKEEVRAAQQGLTKMFPADKAAVDPARQFYGSKGSKPHLFNKILSETHLQKLIEVGREPLNQSDLDGRFRVAGTRSSLSLEHDLLVRTSRGEMKNISELESAQPVYCPYHQDSNASAFTTISKSGSLGIHCSSCQQTFWQKDKASEKYDFLQFDKLAHKEYRHGIGEMQEDSSGLVFDVPNPNMVISSRFLPVDDIGIVNGITLIKSPKGSGKTQYLKGVVENYRKKKLSVLLIGHRRSLLQALSSSLGLVCYLDTKGVDNYGGRNSAKYFAISVDSLATQLKPHYDKFDVVLVDESEQVLSHLIADTLDPEKRRKCYLLFQHYIKVAKHVIALDADLNNISIHAIQRFGNKNPMVDRRLILNEYKAKTSNIELCPSENQLIGSLFESLEKGERIFVACNSKKQVDELSHSIKLKFGDAVPIMSITATNSGQPEIINFVKNIKTEILNFKVLIVSPAMGTGIDITFPDNVSHVDGVYGLFHAKVNTHFEIDQQISRVRQPKYVRVWISPQIFNFEYEVDPIRQELAESGEIPEVLNGYLNNGMPDYNWADPYLTLYATIISAQRASKNRLKENFIDLRKYNGWNILEVQQDKAIATDGRVHGKKGEELRSEQYIHNILHARQIDYQTASQFSDRNKYNIKPLTEDEHHSFERYWLESFYREPISQALIAKDNREQYRNKIRNIEGLLATYSANAEVGKFSNAPAHKLLAKIFESTGLLNSSGEWNTAQVITMESLQNFVKMCKASNAKAKFQRLLDIEIRKDVGVKPVTQLNAILNLCGLDLVKFKEHSKGNQKVYEYQLNSNSFIEVMQIINTRKTPTSTSI